jgi:hypothetical protein
MFFRKQKAEGKPDALSLLPKKGTQKEKILPLARYTGQRTARWQNFTPFWVFATARPDRKIGQCREW